MPIDITMPRLSDTMEAGTIIKWNVKEGDKVSAGDVIADVETDKATMEMTAYDDGTVSKIAVPEGKRVNVGEVIAVLNGGGEGAGEAKKQPAAARRDEPSAETREGRPQEKSRAKSASTEAGDGEAESGATGTAVAERPSAAQRGKPAPAAPGDREDEAPRERPRPPAAGERPSKPAREEQEGDEHEPEDQDQEQATGDGRMRISPVARHLADEHGIDPRSIEGTGPSGRVIKRDVLAAIDAAKETGAAVVPSARAKPQAETRPRQEVLATRVEKDQPSATTLPAKAGPARVRAPATFAGEGVGLEAQMVPLSNVRQIIARRLVESKQTIPHYQVTATFNMDPLLELREALNAQLESQGVKLSVNDFLVRACALAIHSHPYFNAAWAEDHIEILGDINVGIAISLPEERGGGLVVGVIRNVDAKGLRQISMESKALAEKARARGLTIQEMSDSTFTISNLGMYGVDNFTAIINPPNSAILAVGAALKKPVVRDDQLTIGHEMNATLSLDHRVIDGAMAAQYLQTLRQFIENPGTVLV
jgi:pyruvate dehydrogenase E2 component (dihydrolipoamide acetyltransferase)